MEPEDLGNAVGKSDIAIPVNVESIIDQMKIMSIHCFSTTRFQA
jgi:hypothetical protein